MDFLDFQTLRVIWWILLGVLLIGFALTDGYDLGVGALLPFVAKTDVERRMVINSVAPHWEGHQVWFILGGGAIFAAWPFVYAVSFSGFYLAMFVVLAALILRPVGFKYRSKKEDPAWRSRWDWALFIGGFVPALVFGVAVGNVLLGVPFRLDSDLRAWYDGSFIGLFRPFALVCGLLSVAMLVTHGAAWLAVKIEEGEIPARARRIGSIAAIAAIVLFALGGAMVAFGSMGYRVSGRRPVRPVEPAALEHRAARRWLARQLRRCAGDAARARSPASPARCSRCSASARAANGSPSAARRWRRSASSPRSARRCSPSSCRRASTRTRA